MPDPYLFYPQFLVIRPSPLKEQTPFYKMLAMQAEILAIKIQFDSFTAADIPKEPYGPLIINFIFPHQGGDTLLHVAARARNEVAYRLLLEAGADLTQQNFYNVMPEDIRRDQRAAASLSVTPTF